jgi:hypothetical protein
MNKLDIVVYLIKKGVDLHVEDNKGNLAIDLCDKSLTQQDVFNALIEAMEEKEALMISTTTPIITTPVITAPMITNEVITSLPSTAPVISSPSSTSSTPVVLSPSAAVTIQNNDDSAIPLSSELPKEQVFTVCSVDSLVAEASLNNNSNIAVLLPSPIKVNYREYLKQKLKERKMDRMIKIAER